MTEKAGKQTKANNAADAGADSLRPPPELTRLVRGTMASTIAGIFSLSAFTVSVLAGLSSGNDAASILVRALIAMAVCYPVGLAAGFVADRVVREQIEQHRKTHPDEERAEGGAARASDARPQEAAQPASNDQTEEDVLIV